MSVQVYGIPSCTTVRKSLKWLEAEGIAHDFTAFAKLDDLGTALKDWIALGGQDRVMNARAATFRALPEAEQAQMQSDVEYAIARMVEDPRLIKRPVLVANGRIATGFREADWRDIL